jgi:hypothetical protein
MRWWIRPIWLWTGFRRFLRLERATVLIAEENRLQVLRHWSGLSFLIWLNRVTRLDWLSGTGYANGSDRLNCFKGFRRFLRLETATVLIAEENRLQVLRLLSGLSSLIRLNTVTRLDWLSGKGYADGSDRLNCFKGFRRFFALKEFLHL